MSNFTPPGINDIIVDLHTVARRSPQCLAADVRLAITQAFRDPRCKGMSAAEAVQRFATPSLRQRIVNAHQNAFPRKWGIL